MRPLFVTFTALFFVIASVVPCSADPTSEVEVKMAAIFASGPPRFENKQLRGYMKRAQRDKKKYLANPDLSLPPVSGKSACPKLERDKITQAIWSMSWTEAEKSYHTQGFKTVTPEGFRVVSGKCKNGMLQGKAVVVAALRSSTDLPTHSMKMTVHIALAATFERGEVNGPYRSITHASTQTTFKDPNTRAMMEKQSAFTRALTNSPSLSFVYGSRSGELYDGPQLTSMFQETGPMRSTSIVVEAEPSKNRQ